MQIMQELLTNKRNFPLMHTKDFNQTAHVAAYEPIVFNDNFSFYFNSLSSVHGFIRVTNVHIMVISTLLDIFSSFVVERVLKLKTHSLQHGYLTLWIVRLFSKWWKVVFLQCVE